MRELPDGTVTFVFTDIEGSTKLLHDLGSAAYADALAQHRRIVRAAFAAGAEVDTQGDAFFYAFARASDALEACVRALAALEDGPVRIRVGVHTGEPLRTDEGYVGADVHRAARIAAAAHGGQIVVSQTTRDLAPDAELRDLGEHRLKDLRAAERLYQLGGGDFPPLRSLYRTNLPIPARPIVGREQELTQIRRLVDDGRRLVTLTGPGGSGKTRLAVEAAAELADSYPDGVFFAGLADVAEQERVPSALAAAVGFREQQGGRATVPALGEFLATKRLLLVVDNLEHVIDASPILARLLDAAPQLVVLATSREPLRLGYECELPVDPLTEREAVALFWSRAHDTVPTLGAAEETVVAICRRVDCLPLAVELAAARVKLLGAEGLLAALDHRLDVLRSERRDAPARQRTLRATIEWSYDLMADEERRVFEELAVFAGGCSAGAAAAVCRADLDVLGSLLDKSLIRRREVDGEVRFWLLQVIGEFALEQLGVDREVELRRAHLHFFTELAAQAEPALWRRDQARWLRTLDLEYPNLRAALAFALRDEADIETGAALAASLQDYWDIRGQLREGALWLSRALSHSSQLSPYTLGRASIGAAVMGGRGDQTSEVIPLLSSAAATFRAIGAVAAETRAIGMLAPWLAMEGGDRARERALSAAARAREAAAEAGDDVSAFLAESAAAEVAWWDDVEASSAAFEHAAEMCRRRGDSRNEAITLGNLAETLYAAGRSARAEAALERAVAIARELEDPGVVSGTLFGLATLQLLDGRRADATTLLREGVRLAREHGTYYSLSCLPCVALLADDRAAAAALLSAYDAAVSGPRWAPEPPATVAIAARARAALDESAQPQTAPTVSAAFDLAAAVLG